MAPDTGREFWLGAIREASLACEVALKESGSIPASFVVFGEEEVLHFVCSIDSHDHKAKVFDLMLIMAVALAAYGVMLVSETESRCSVQSPDEDDDAFRRRMLAGGDSSPELCAVAVYYDDKNVRRAIAQHVPMTISADGVEFGKPDISDASRELFGAVVELLPVKPLAIPLQMAAADWIVRNGEKQMRKLSVFTLVDSEWETHNGG